MRWVLQRTHQVPVHLGMGWHMSGSSHFGSFNLHDDLFYRRGSRSLKELMTWPHELGDLGSGPGLSLLPQSTIVE